MSSEIQQQILDPKDYIEIQGPVEHKGEPEKLRYKILEHVNSISDEEGKTCKLDENLIITYSERRAQKDRAHRERLLEKAKKLVEEPGKINAGIKRGGRKSRV
ncbi:MAG: hypothetical protein HPY66_2022 [Firmicutes bacterium]|nr:hypothetical protein [Bacillota bacterium]